MAAIEPRTAARRHECKYEIPEDLARAIRDAVAPHVVPDVHAADRRDNTYPIASLYFDTSGLSLFQETKEGKDRRFKLRVRAYDDDPANPVFLEIKRRNGALVHKTRAPVMRPDLACLLPDDLEPRAHLERAPGLESEFLLHVHRLGARPRVVVRYDREAYVGAIDDTVRVTFDRGLRFLATNTVEVPVDSPRYVAVPKARVVLELKFNRACPYWLQVLVRRFELARRSFSKYGHSIKARSAALDR